MCIPRLIYIPITVILRPRGIDKNKINEVVAAILEEFRKLAGKPVEQGELQRAKIIWLAG